LVGCYHRCSLLTAVEQVLPQQWHLFLDQLLLMATYPVAGASTTHPAACKLSAPSATTV
jgi:hypothetical protein